MGSFGGGNNINGPSNFGAATMNGTTNFGSSGMNGPSNFGGGGGGVTKLGYGPQDIASEARYEQYLRANASTLANIQAYNRGTPYNANVLPDGHYAGREDQHRGNNIN